MKKYLFCAPPRYGHVKPTLAVVETLVAQGAEVVYLCTEMFAGMVQATGASFQAYRSTNLGLSMETATFQESSDPLLNECFYVFPQIWETVRSEQIDCIIYDGLCLWGRMLAEALRLPAIMYTTTYTKNEHFRYQDYTNKFKKLSLPLTVVTADMRKGLERFCARYAIPSLSWEEVFSHAEPLNLVFMPRAFHPLAETFDEERFKFIGPFIGAADGSTNFPLNRLSDKPVIYASRGTMYNRVAGIIDIILSAFGRQEQQLVVALGPYIDRRVFGPLPKNVLLYPQIPQLAVLRCTDIFITHGGINSVMEALAHGVPMIVCPFLAEECATAYRIQELKLGIAIDHDAVTAHTLRTAVATIRNDPDYHSNARCMQQLIQQTDATQSAVREILAYRDEHVTHLL